jgi:hypothetical protein
MQIKHYELAKTRRAEWWNNVQGVTLQGISEREIIVSMSCHSRTLHKFPPKEILA